MENKTKLITPTLMLVAAAVASITMFIKNYELYTMLWVLLVVLIVFYIIGDVVRYIYASVRPCILPQSPDLEVLLAKTNVQDDEEEVAEADEELTENAEHVVLQEANEYDSMQDSQADENSEEIADAYEDSYEEYTDENLDEM